MEVNGTATNLKEVGYQLGIQVVAMNPVYSNKEEVPADIVTKEIEIETARAIEEGKPQNIAENIAKGRVNKEFFQRDVLLEQVFYADTKKNVSAYVSEESKAGSGTIAVKRFVKLVVGQSSAE